MSGVDASARNHEHGPDYRSSARVVTRMPAPHGEARRVPSAGGGRKGRLPWHDFRPRPAEGDRIGREGACRYAGVLPLSAAVATDFGLAFVLGPLSFVFALVIPPVSVGTSRNTGCLTSRDHK